MELDDQPVCTEEDLAVMNWPAPAGELETAAGATETNALCVPKVAPHFSHADAPPAALRWVASVFATNERMAAVPPRPTDEWWNEVRRCEGRLVAYEPVPGNAPVMPYGDIDVKLRNIASDKGSAFIEKTNMVALSKSLCRAILPALVAAIMSVANGDFVECVEDYIANYERSPRDALWEHLPPAVGRVEVEVPDDEDDDGDCVVDCAIPPAAKRQRRVVELVHTRDAFGRATLPSRNGNGRTSAV